MREIKTSDKDAIKKTAFTIFAKKMRRDDITVERKVCVYS